MRALFAIPLRAICWTPWSGRHGRDAAAVKCSEGVRGGWSGRTRRSLSLLLAIYRPLSLIGLCRRAPLYGAVTARRRSWLSAVSIGLARRAPLTDAVALETRAVTVGLVAPDPVGHRQEQECPAHVAKFVCFSQGWDQISTPLPDSSTLGPRRFLILKARNYCFKSAGAREIELM